MNNEHKSEKILEILIGVFIILILVSVYIQYLKPFIAELSAQKKDPIRIQDLSSVNSAIAKLQEINPNFFSSEPNKIYISLPSSNANCEGLKLPSLADGWEYRCKPETEYRRIDGNGWMPVDFTKLPKDFDFKSSLPIDLVNAADSGYYYAYVVDEKNNWVLTSLLESDKSLKEIALKDGGTDPTRLEVGSNLQLWAKASGLVSYWKFDEGNGTTTADSSDNNNTGLINEPVWTDGKIGKALSFGRNDYVDAGNAASLNITDAITIEAWVKGGSWTDATWNTIVSKGGYRTTPQNGYELLIMKNRVRAELWNNETSIPIDITVIFDQSIWHCVTFTNDGSTLTLYLDGVNIGTAGSGNYTSSIYNLYIGQRYGGNDRITGTIDEVRIYNRALSAEEVRAIYDATK